MLSRWLSRVQGAEESRESMAPGVTLPPLFLLRRAGARRRKRRMIRKQAGGGVAPIRQGVHHVQDALFLFLPAATRPLPDEDAFQGGVYLRLLPPFVRKAEHQPHCCMSGYFRLKGEFAAFFVGHRRRNAWRADGRSRKCLGPNNIRPPIVVRQGRLWRTGLGGRCRRRRPMSARPPHLDRLLPCFVRPMRRQARRRIWPRF